MKPHSKRGVIEEILDMIGNLDIPEDLAEHETNWIPHGVDPERVSSGPFLAVINELSEDDRALIAMDWPTFAAALNGPRPTRHALRVALMPIRARFGLLERLPSEELNAEFEQAIRARMRAATVGATEPDVPGLAEVVLDHVRRSSVLYDREVERFVDANDEFEPGDAVDELANPWRSRFIALACVTLVMGICSAVSIYQVVRERDDRENHAEGLAQAERRPVADFSMGAAAPLLMDDGEFSGCPAAMARPDTSKPRLHKMAREKFDRDFDAVIWKGEGRATYKMTIEKILSGERPPETGVHGSSQSRTRTISRTIMEDYDVQVDISDTFVVTVGVLP